jgi:hypothetical protein
VHRGFVWAGYIDDLGAVWAVKVDADYAADPARGWQTVDPTAVPQLPRGWLTRAVFGLDEVGRAIRATAASTSSAIWSGTVSTFSFYASDQVAHTASIIERRAERRLPRNQGGLTR